MNVLARIGKWFKRTFDAAGASGRWPWRASMADQRLAALAQRSVIASRAAYLVNNAPVAESIVNTWAVNLVSDGPSTRSGHPSKAMARALEAGWSKFFAVADIEGGDLVSVLNRIVRGMVGDGECFVRFVTTQRGELRLQILVPDQIATDRDNGVNIIGGIEFADSGERLAYWIRPYANRLINVMNDPVRVPASEICHCYDPKMSGQVRGLSWLTPVATSILELDSLQDALLAKAKVSALFCGFIQDLDGSTNPTPDDDHLSMEPGILRKLGAGQSITFPPTSDFTGTDAFLKHMLRQIASGSGVPYELLSADLSDTNYSSAKLGLEAFKRRCRAIRASILVSRFLQPVWERFVTLEILSGRINAVDFERNAEAYFSATFLFPEWAALDPLKEAESDVLLLKSGIRSRAEIIAARGRDISDVNQEIDADTHKDMVANVTALRPAAEASTQAA